MQPCINWTAIDAIAEVVATVITALSIIILVWQNMRESKQHKESTIRSEWYILQAERQRIETDMNKFHPAPQSVYTKLVDRHREISEQMHKLRKQYPDVLSDWPPPPQTFETLIEAESDSPK